MIKQQYKNEHPNADEDEIEEHLKKISGISEVPHVTLCVENFFPPDQARKFANDVLHLGGIDNPQTLMPIDFNFRRKIIENDHCYTPLTRSPEPSEKSKKSKDVSGLVTKGKRETKPSTKVRQITETNDDSSDSEGAGGEDDDEYEDEQSEEEESFSESDDDNDMDFSVNDRFGKKGTKKKRKYRRQKQKSISFKDFLEGSADLVDDEPKKKYGKVSKKAQQSSRSSIGGSIKATSTATSSKTQQPPMMKKIQAKLTPQIRQFTNSSTFKAATTTSSSSSSTSSMSANQIHTKNTEKEIVESIAKDLEKSYPESNPTSPVKKPPTTESIPNIISLIETNTSQEVLDQSLSTLEHIDTADGGASIEEIGDALIAALGNEAIDELLNQGDLMNFDSSQNLKSSLLSDTMTSPSTSVLASAPVTPTNTSVTMPKILNKQAPQKDPIKIVKNGRVITLPPIEAPATRGAKRRAQGDPITQSPTSVTSTSPVSAIAATILSTPPGIIKVPKTEKNDSRNSSRRSSLNKSESGKNSRRQSTTAARGDEEKDEDANSDATWNSEDDPDRLWCICRTPHSNRFMICCDKCLDWFHGTCVNISKAQGKIMEEKNTKWLCPGCKTGGAIKKDPNKKPLNQQKLTKFFSKHQKESTDEDVPKSLVDACVVCNKKSARADSIYCSDECIQNHATKVDESTLKTPTTPQKTEGKRGNILKDQEGKVSDDAESCK